MGGAVHYRPNITAFMWQFWVYRLPFAQQKCFFIISFRNKPLLGLCGACG